MHTVANVVSSLESIAPRTLAAAWDNVGLLLGDPAARVERLMTCLTVTPDTVAEAIEGGVHMIVSHHPIFFRPVQKLTTATPEGRMVLHLVQAGVAIYSAHTAFDNCKGGINELLAAKLGLVRVAPLRPGDSVKQCKVVVFVPDKDLAKVSDAMFAAGAGKIGEYRECSFRLEGTGTFFGTEETNPTLGERGRREEVSEWRLEVLCAEADVDRVVTAMRSTHSYEEPAYDVYALRGERGKTGEGRLGVLASPMPLSGFVQAVKSVLGAAKVEWVGAAEKRVERVAVACGAAGEFLADAIRAGADAFVTGEARFHDALAADAQRVALVLPGHYASERLGVESLADRLASEFPALQIWASRRERDPLAVV